MWVNYNGRFYPDTAVSIAANDLAWQYGLSLFETIRWTGGQIPLWEGHLKRLTAGLELLRVGFSPFFTPAFLREEIQRTIAGNSISGDARVRLQVSPSANTATGIFEGIHYKIESIPCERLLFNEAGLDAGITQCSFLPNPLPFAAFKTGNYGPYFLASQEAKRRGLDEVFLLNHKNRIGEASASNVFWKQNGQFFTPPLSEGIVAGVGRGRLIEVLSKMNLPFEEVPLTTEHLRKADSLYLTNAFRGLRWVKSCEGIAYAPGEAESLFRKAFSLLC